MKFILPLIFIAGINIHSSSQVFYKGNNSDEFKNLKEFGIKYIRTGGPLDKKLEEGLKKYWKSTKYKIIDPKTEKYQLTDSDIVLSINRIRNKMHYTSSSGVSTDASYNEDILCLISGKVLASEKITKDNIIGCVTIDVGTDTASMNFY